MNKIMLKINCCRHKNHFVILMLIIFSLYVSGCYTTKELFIDGSRLRDRENYDEINNLKLKDSSVILFGDKYQNHDATYLSKYGELKDIILFTTGVDTAKGNERSQVVKKYHSIDVNSVLTAKVSIRKLNPWLTAGVIGGTIIAFLAVLAYIAFSSGFNGGFHISL